MTRVAALVAAAAEKLGALALKDVIPCEQQVVFLEHNASVANALATLAQRHLLSAPLVVLPGLEDSMGSSSGDEPAPPQLIGWITVESILRAFLQHLEEKHGKLPRNMLLLMTQLEKEGPAFAEKLLITVAGSEDRGLVFQVNSDVSLQAALRESFVPAGKPAAHRLAVFDARGTITAVVSQLDIIRYLRDRPELLGDLASATVGELGWAPAAAAGTGGAANGRPLVTVEASLPALLAFERMARAGVSGAPVVADMDAAVSGAAGNGSGCMIANLSMSDLRNIQSQHFGVLALPVGEFLALLHNTAYLGYEQRTSSAAAHPFFAAGPPSVPPPPSLARRSPSASPAAGGRSSHPGASPGAAGAARVGSPGGGGGAGAGAAAAGGGGGAVPMETGPEGVGGAGEGGSGGGGGGDGGIRMITCGAETTLMQLLRCMADNRVHRVYVTRPGPSGLPLPVGVVTPTDCLRLLAGSGK